jgi:pyruvate formate lyase activating enzyme
LTGCTIARSPRPLPPRRCKLGCRSVAFTYNDPVIFLEYAIGTAQACRAAGLATVAVTAGYVAPEARREFFAHIDAGNVDLKAFTEDFYRTICGGHLDDVLDTLVYLKRDASVWFEITTLLIPGENDSDAEIDALSCWMTNALGPDVPLHFTAFHPDWKMRDKPVTSAATLSRARAIARANGLRYVYTGNVHDKAGGSTWCHGCGGLLIGRDWFDLTQWNLTDGRCCKCGSPLAGVFEPRPGSWGRRRHPVLLRH